MRRDLGITVILVAVAGCLACGSQKKPDLPNFVWVVTEDHSRDDVACYGNPDVNTPNMDCLAAEGVRFTNAFSAAPSCAPTRSGLITGMYPISLGAQHQRNDSAVLPEGVRLLPQYLRDAGYLCINATWDFTKPGKKDYQFQWDRNNTWDKALDWNEREPGQPFFAQLHIAEPHRDGHGKIVDRVFARDTERPIAPASVHLPPYYPDDPVARIDFAQYLEAVQVADRKLGSILKRLEDDGLADNTVVFFFGDHGRPFPHGKQFVYDEGLAIPFIIRWPGELARGSVREDLVSMIDFAPTLLHVAGIDVPSHMHGAPLLGKGANEREYIYASRDRVDDAVDRIRCVRTRKFKYIRNFYPEKPYDMSESYMLMMHPTLSVLRHWHEQGKLNEVQVKWMAPSRPKEELYDLEKDPWETKNVADDPAYAQNLQQLRAKLNSWIEQTGDKGQFPENEESLDKIRAEFQDRLKVRLEALGIKSVDQLYDAWARNLKPTQPVTSPVQTK